EGKQLADSIDAVTVRHQQYDLGKAHVDELIAKRFPESAVGILVHVSVTEQQVARLHVGGFGKANCDGVGSYLRLQDLCGRRQVVIEDRSRNRDVRSDVAVSAQDRLRLFFLSIRAN